MFSVEDQRGAGSEPEAVYPGADPWEAREAEVALAQGRPAAQVCRILGIAEQTF